MKCEWNLNTDVNKLLQQIKKIVFSVYKDIFIYRRLRKLALCSYGEGGWSLTRGYYQAAMTN